MGGKTENCFAYPVLPFRVWASDHGTCWGLSIDREVHMQGHHYLPHAIGWFDREKILRQDRIMDMAQCEPFGTGLDTNTDHLFIGRLKNPGIFSLTLLPYYGYIPIMAHYNPFPGNGIGI